MSKVVKINNIDDYKAFKNAHSKGIVFYSSESCHACKKIEPLYIRIANRYHDKIAMAYTDIDECKLNFKQIPFFVSLDNGEQRDTLSGSNPEELKQFIREAIIS